MTPILRNSEIPRTLGDTFVKGQYQAKYPKDKRMPQDSVTDVSKVSIAVSLRQSTKDSRTAPLKDRKELIKVLKESSADFAMSQSLVFFTGMIDGPLATYLLRYNWNNRPSVDLHVTKMILDANSDRFPLMPEPIIFVSYSDDDETFCWDGQNRLETARLYGAEEGNALEFNILVVYMDRATEQVCRAAEAEARTRSMGDITHELNLPEAVSLDVTRLYLYPHMKRRGVVSVPQMMQDFQRVGERVTFALTKFDDCLNEEDKINLKRFRVGAAVGMLHSFELAPKHALDFYSVFFRPEGHPDSHPARVMRREIMARAGAEYKAYRRHPMEIRALFYAIFTWYHSQRTHYPNKEPQDFDMSLIHLTPREATPEEYNVARPAEFPEAIDYLAKLTFA